MTDWTLDTNRARRLAAETRKKLEQEKVPPEGRQRKNWLRGFNADSMEAMIDNFSQLCEAVEQLALRVDDLEMADADD